LTNQTCMSPEAEAAQQLARRYGINSAEVLAIANAMDQARGMLTPHDLQVGLQNVVAVYVGAMQGAVEHFSDPAERAQAERFASIFIDQLAGQLEGGAHQRN
jgi:hypothetical protein